MLGNMEYKGLWEDGEAKKGTIYKVIEYYLDVDYIYEPLIESTIFTNKEFAENFLKKRIREISFDVFEEKGVIWYGKDIKRIHFEVQNLNGTIIIKNDRQYVSLHLIEDKLVTDSPKICKDNPEPNKKCEGLWGDDFSLWREDYDGYVYEMKKVMKDVASYTIGHMDKERCDLNMMEEEDDINVIEEFYNYVEDNHLDYRDMWDSISYDDMQEITKSFWERWRDEVWRKTQERRGSTK